MRTVVLGSAGQLGRDLVPRLPGEVVSWTRADVDLALPTTLAQRLDEVRPDVVVNCAAYNLVDHAETDSASAFAVNAWGAYHLAVACQQRGIKLVHFSTDYVFGVDGQRTTPWQETDAPGPVSQYGLSKLTGEYLVQAYCPNHLILRTCGLYGVWGSGGKGGNFVETMLNLAARGKTWQVVNDQRCTPSYCGDVAEATVALLAANATGLFHVTNAGSCTWYELAQEIFRQSHMQPDLSPTTAAAYARPARRPAYSVLALDKLSAYGVPAMRPWQAALAAYLHERRQKQ